MNSNTQPALRVERLTEMEQFDDCVEMQNQVWGYSPAELFPRRIFHIAQKIGGQVIGAYDGERLAGFAMAMPAYRDGMAYLHSQMLAVAPEYRNTGIGRRLKWAQREDAIARGFRYMEWTFDPLEIKNANLNINKLGAVVCRYAPDFYGHSSSPLQGGLPTDRLYAEWWLQSDRVRRAEHGIMQPSFEAVAEVLVPCDVAAWKSDPAERGRAATVQANNREAMQQHFADGLTILGFRTEPSGDGVFLFGQGEAAFTRETA